MTIQISFNNYDLPRIVSWSEDNDTRLAAVTIVRKSGSLIDAVSCLEPRVISVKGYIYAASSALVTAELDLLTTALNIGRSVLVFQDRWIWATKQNFKINYITGMQCCGLEYSATFYCDDPYWYKIDTTTYSTSLTGNTQVCEITTGGTSDCYGTFTITPSGTMTKLRLLNGHASVQQWIEFDGSVAAGNALVINCELQTATNNGVNCLPNMTGDFFVFKGGVLNSIVVSGIGHAGVLSCAYLVRWQ